MREHVLEEELQGVLLVLFLPGLKVLAFTEVDLDIRDFKADRLIRLRCNQQVLVLGIGLFDSLLERRHNSVLRLRLVCNLRVENFEEERFLFSFRVLLFEHFVSRLADLLNFRAGLLELALHRVHGVALFAQLASVQIGLMLLAGSVGEVRVLSRVQRQAESTLKRTQVIAKNIRVIRDVGCFDLQLPQSLFAESFKVRGTCLHTRTGLGADSILHVHFNQT